MSFQWLHGSRIEILNANAGFCLMQFELTKGYSAARHTHQREAEIFVVVEGVIEVSVESDVSVVSAGGVAILPIMVPHRYSVKSKRAKLLCICIPGGIDRFFREAAQALMGSALTAVPQEIMAEIAGHYGIMYD